MDKKTIIEHYGGNVIFFLYAKTSKCNILDQFFKESKSSAGGEIGLGGWVVELLHRDREV